MKLPASISFFWRLVALLVATILLTLWLTWSWSKAAEQQSAYLSEAERKTLIGYANAAEQALQQSGTAGAQAWLDALREREGIWAVLVDGNLQSLTGEALSSDDKKRLTFLRTLDSPLRRNRFNLVPDIVIPFHGDTEAGLLAMQLPQRYMQDDTWAYYSLFIDLLPPLLASLLLGLLIHRQLIRPLHQLREQANNLRADNLDERLPASLSTRRDELGELSAAFNHMADRVQRSLEFQRQLLRDLSHELRTPLSRLAVARESSQDLASLQQRLDQEILIMRRLVENTLKLAWLDTEKPQLTLEPICLPRLWDLIVEDAGFESGWSAQRFPCLLGDDCIVLGHLNGLYQALENLVRNAIRHSPDGGTVSFAGQREGEHWHVWVRDHGPGVEPDDLQRIFTPFVRLNGARPADGGFGLGLSIAHSALKLQGATLWAENAEPGLAIHMRLPVA